MKPIFKTQKLHIFLFTILNAAIPSFAGDISGDIVYGKGIDRQTGRYIERELKIIPVPVGKVLDDEGLGSSVSLDDTKIHFNWTGTSSFDVIWDSDQEPPFTVYAVWPERRTVTGANCGKFEISHISDLADKAMKLARSSVSDTSDASWLDAARHMNMLGRILSHCKAPVGKKPAWRIYYDAAIDMTQWSTKTDGNGPNKTAVCRAWVYQSIEQLETAAPSPSRIQFLSARLVELGHFGEVAYLRPDAPHPWAITQTLRELSVALEEHRKTGTKDTVFNEFLMPDWERHDADMNLSAANAYTRDVELMFKTVIAHKELETLYRRALDDPKALAALHVGREPDKEFAFRTEAIKAVGSAIERYRSRWTNGDNRDDRLQECLNLPFNQTYYFYDSLRLLNGEEKGSLVSN